MSAPVLGSPHQIGHRCSCAQPPGGCLYASAFHRSGLPAYSRSVDSTWIAIGHVAVVREREGRGAWGGCVDQSGRPSGYARKWRPTVPGAGGSQATSLYIPPNCTSHMAGDRTAALSLRLSSCV